MITVDKHKSIWNTHHGCRKCSEGCRNCYMYALDAKRGVERASSEVYRLSRGLFDYPLKKNRHGEYKIRSGERIMVNMTSDTFIEEADEWREEMWSIIRQRSDVIFWLLTKRPERVYNNLPADWGDGYPNVMMNITCENQDMYNRRIKCFLDIPAKHKGLCIAPILSYIDISYALESKQIEEVSVGGENYDNPRICDYRWVKRISDICAEYRVNFCWYETGSRLLYNGNVYYLPTKQKQMSEAFFSGLNHKYYDIGYDLRYPDGTEVPEENMYKKQYNMNHCIFCSNQMICNGCTLCGNCGNDIQLVNESDFEITQSRLLKEKEWGI